MKCPKCGTIIPDNSNVCNSCGAVVSSMDGSEPKVSKVDSDFETVLKRTASIETVTGENTQKKEIPMEEKETGRGPYSQPVSLQTPKTPKEKPIISFRPRDEKFEDEEPREQIEPKKENYQQNTIVILVILCIAVAIVAISVLVFYQIQNNKGNVVTVSGSSIITETTMEEATTQDITVEGTSLSK